MKAAKEPFVSTQSLSTEIASLSRKYVGAQTIRSILHCAGIYSPMARREPFINDKASGRRMGIT